LQRFKKRKTGWGRIHEALKGQGDLSSQGKSRGRRDLVRPELESGSASRGRRERSLTSGPQWSATERARPGCQPENTGEGRECAAGPGPNAGLALRGESELGEKGEKPGLRARFQGRNFLLPFFIPFSKAFPKEVLNPFWR